MICSQELPVRVNANGHVYGQVDLDDDSDKSNSNYHKPYPGGQARRPSVLLSPDYTGKSVVVGRVYNGHYDEHSSGTQWRWSRRFGY